LKTTDSLAESDDLCVTKLAALHHWIEMKALMPTRENHALVLSFLD